MTSRLSKQQKRRIKQQHNDRLSGQNIDDAPIVVAHMGYEAIVSDSGQLIAADWRKPLGEIAVNDRVLMNTNDDRPVIEAIFPRKHTLYKWHGRKVKCVATHIDQLIVVIAVRPQWQSSLLDRYLIAAHHADIEVCIVCNKVDLIDRDARKTWMGELKPYIEMGYTVLPISVNSGERVSEVQAQLENKQSVICGQSGVGKSSLISTLIPNSDIWVQSLSATTDFGRHTTTNSRRYPLSTKGAVIDTPGVRGFAVSHLSAPEIIAGFKDIAALTGSCRFNDCSHRHEPDCAVLKALAQGSIAANRYHSLMQILEELPT